jgi:acyl-CoA synthetase (AMP-forming)/AMP-acid ligase II
MHDTAPGLPERIREHARDPLHSALVMLDGTGKRLTYRELWEQSGGCVAALRTAGARAGDRVAVVMTTRWETVVLLVALQRLGCTLVPLLDATPREGDARAAQVLGALRAGRPCWCVAPTAAVTGYSAAIAARGVTAEVLALEDLVRPEHPGAGEAHLPPPADDHLLLIQFSSGSTALPKGVCLTRGSIWAHLAATTGRLQLDRSDVVVTWLPLYHDMGLVGAIFGSLWAGCTVVLQRPQDFVRNPLGWLEAISRHRGTFTTAPQFAYSLCLTRSQGPAARERLQALDLSSLRTALNGSETVHWELSSRFTERFAEFGLGRDVLQPAYGLAENCVAVTLRDPGTPVQVRRLSRAALAEGVLLAAGDDGGAGAQTTVGAGVPIPGTRVSIRDEQGREVGPDGVGQVFVSGSSSMAAYCDADGELRPAGTGGWVPTGDVGAWIDGELHVLGRLKEIIKCGGRTFVPSDIEATIASRLRDDLGAVAAFGFYDPAAGSEQLVVVAEAGVHPHGEGAEALSGRIRMCVLQEFQLPVRDVVLVRGRSIPRTSSGKIQRVRLQHAYADGGPAALATR